MEDRSKELLSRKGLVIDLVLALVFFLAFTFLVIPPHVPAESPAWILFWSAYTSLSLAAVFWMGLQLFRVTLVDFQQRQTKS